MTKLELLSLFLTDRLTSAAQEIYKMIEDTFAEHQAEITYVKRENEFLRKQFANNRPRKYKVKRGPRQITTTVSAVSLTPPIQQQQSPEQEWIPSPATEILETEEKKQESNTSQEDEPLQDTRLTEVPTTLTPTTHILSKDSKQGTFKTLPQNQEDTKLLTPLPTTFLLAPPSKPLQIRQKQAIVLSHKISPLVIQVVKKTFICKECGKTFRYMSRLKQHMRMAHTQEKPHCCTFCGKCFLTASKLKTHQLIHTGERPYLCNVCGHCFNQKSNLKVHMQRKHKDLNDCVKTYDLSTPPIQNTQGHTSFESASS